MLFSKKNKYKYEQKIYKKSLKYRVFYIFIFFPAAIPHYSIFGWDMAHEHKTPQVLLFNEQQNKQHISKFCWWLCCFLYWKLLLDNQILITVKQQSIIKSCYSFWTIKTIIKFHYFPTESHQIVYLLIVKSEYGAFKY